MRKYKLIALVLAAVASIVAGAVTAHASTTAEPHSRSWT